MALRAHSLECRHPRASQDSTDLKAMRAAAFHHEDMAVLPLGQLPEMERVVVVQICERMYGRRRG